MASRLFSERVLQELILHRQFGVHLLRRRFSSAIAFISPISEASMPPNFERQL
jgi:hypothetical protein